MQRSQLAVMALKGHFVGGSYAEKSKDRAKNNVVGPQQTLLFCVCNKISNFDLFLMLACALLRANCCPGTCPNASLEPT